MSTVVEICNMAIAMAGSQELIEDLTDDTTAAALCRLFYPSVRDGLLRKGTYPIARKTAALAALSSGVTIPQQWTYAYSLPTECLRVFGVTTTYVDPNTIPQIFSVQNEYREIDVVIPSKPYELSVNDAANARVLFTNISPAYLLYTQRIETAGLFDPGLEDAIVTVLASRICYPLTQKLARSNGLKAEAAQMIEEAEAQGANEQNDSYDFVPDHIMVR